ncbi:MAG TPA: TerC family protein [Polyangiaceae bacterium]|nr:TerC family protein [Polyangiaceae bacterium]
MGLLLWGGFFLLVFALLALDLGVFHKKPHAIGTREALGWTAVWVAVSMVFNVGVYFIYENHLPVSGGEFLGGRDAAVRFFTAYLIEKMLSLDNIFVIAAIMASFRVPSIAQHRVLYWGVLGALIMRGTMIFAGTAAIHRFAWLMYVLGALLLFTGVKMFGGDDDDDEMGENAIVGFVRRVYPVARDFHGTHFFVVEDGKRAVTPLFLALIAVEATDVLFAVDSVPAVFAVTLDPFIVMTSNVFAILGLRSLFFALQSALDRFHYLKPTLAVILIFVGAKMLVTHHFGLHLDPLISLAVIAGLLTIGTVASVLRERKAS